MLAIAAQASKTIQTPTPTPFGRSSTAATDEVDKKSKLKSYQASEKEFVETNHKLFSLLLSLRHLFSSLFFAFIFH